MGLPRFVGIYLKNNFKPAFIHHLPQNIQVFAIDFNGLIHNAAQYAYGYGMGAELLPEVMKLSNEERFNNFVNLLFKFLTDLIDLVKPTQQIVIAVDGVAPIAKIVQQRSRRYLASQSNTSTIFNNNVITPGTDFMFSLDLKIREWARNYVSTHKIEILYSSFKEPGEGEHKIMDMIRNGSIDKNSTMVINGLDADLVMLSLLAPANNIILMRTTNYLERSNLNDIININTLRMLIKNRLIKSTAIADFVLMMFLIGNDFLPRQPSLENTYPKGVNTIIESYLQINLELTDNFVIDANHLSKLFENLKNAETKLLYEEYHRKVLHRSKMIDDSIIMKETYVNRVLTRESSLDYNKYRNAWYSNALLPKIEIKMDIKPNELIELMCKNYIMSLNWCLQYYNNGLEGVDYNWYYPYYHTPLFSDLYAYLVQYNYIEPMNRTNQEKLSLYEQLLATIPPVANNILPSFSLGLVQSGSFINQYRPISFKVENDGKSTDHELVVYLPFIDPVLFKQFVRSSLSINNEIFQKYASEKTIKYTRPDLEVKTLKSEDMLSSLLSKNLKLQEKEAAKTEVESKGVTLGLPQGGQATRGQVYRGSWQATRGQAMRGQAMRGQDYRGRGRGQATRGQATRGQATRGQASK